MTDKPHKRRKNHLFLPLVLVTVYAGLITPLAYQSGRQNLVTWALNQPEADTIIASDQHDFIAEKLAEMPAMKVKK